eukprot:CAMPEP_0172454496 /NCGR_PEP_ID=MMETSP1065-20121228/11471_1 /TAXON_ID=265537 /ORGANISM="Amphiprora paludosa, Strain CCMP125" /LENGTH=530 /DNA_ID=CAMNT_0013206837 /DNA_START=59 /DNA_END=1651 /DNA_ORIENTATION=-
MSYRYLTAETGMDQHLTTTTTPMVTSSKKQAQVSELSLEPLNRLFEFDWVTKQEEGRYNNVTAAAASPLSNKHQQSLSDDTTAKYPHPPPTWWTDPRMCQSMGQTHCTDTTPVNNGDTWGNVHCALDTCAADSAKALWSQLQSFWNPMLQMITQRLGPQAMFLMIGDSTSLQQMRALECLLEEAFVTTSSSSSLKMYPQPLEKLDTPQVTPMWKDLELLSDEGHLMVVQEQKEQENPVGHSPQIRGEYLITHIRAAKGLYNPDNHVVRMIHNVLRLRENHTHVPLVVLVNQGPWTHCRGQHCQDWHDQLRRFQTLWQSPATQRSPRLANVTLMIRDAPPQHFPTRSGQYIPTFSRSRHQNRTQCRPVANRLQSGEQAAKVRHHQDPSTSRNATATCHSGQSILRDDPARSLRRLPIWGLTARLWNLHNLRDDDCTHYCMAVTSLWNIMMLQVLFEQQQEYGHHQQPQQPDAQARNQSQGARMAAKANSHQQIDQEGWRIASYLNQKSIEETRLDLIAANDVACPPLPPAQ